jgi:leader peptidase (prepilin peptidase) / N-methyltransferase
VPSAALVAAAAAVGLSIGPLLRARVFPYAVAADRPWRYACPHCGHRLVPPGRRGLVATLPPTGRCPACTERVGPPAGAVELTAAVCLAALAWRVGDPLPLLAYCWLVLLGVTLCFVDLAVHRLPDPLTVAAFAGVLVLLGAAALVAGTPARAGWAALNGVGMALVYLVLVLAYPAGMGLGDAKLALSLGTALGWIGWRATALGTAAGFLLGGLVGLTLVALGAVHRKTAIPHGPFMILGTLGTIVFFYSY